MNDIPDVNDAALQQAYRAMLQRRGRHVRDCATPEELLGVVEGKLPESERLRVLRHVGSCTQCRQELELLRLSAAVAERVARPLWRSMPLLAAAASVVLVAGAVALWTRNADGPANGLTRVGTPAGALVLWAPAEDSAASRPVMLVWSALPEARRYEVEVLTRDGAPLFVMTTRDTAAVVPDSVPLEPGGEYRWWVRAVQPDGTQPASAVRRLRIAAP